MHDRTILSAITRVAPFIDRNGTALVLSCVHIRRARVFNDGKANLWPGDDGDYAYLMPINIEKRGEWIFGKPEEPASALIEPRPSGA